MGSIFFSSPLQSQMSFCQYLAQVTADGVGSARSRGLHWGASSHSCRWDIVCTAPQLHVSSVWFHAFQFPWVICTSPAPLVICWGSSRLAMRGRARWQGIQSEWFLSPSSHGLVCWAGSNHLSRCWSLLFLWLSGEVGLSGNWLWISVRVEVLCVRAGGAWYQTPVLFARLARRWIVWCRGGGAMPARV